MLIILIYLTSDQRKHLNIYNFGILRRAEVKLIFSELNLT